MTPSSTRRASHGLAGFTFLELVVVMTLLGILTAAVIPVFSSAVASVQIRSARSDIVSILRAVQERAVSHGREHRVYIDDREMRYWVEHLVGMDGEDKVFERLPEELGDDHYFPQYLEIKRMKARKDRGSKVEYMGCYPNGACDRISIRFEDARNRAQRFTIETGGTLGDIHVESGPTNVVR